MQITLSAVPVADGPGGFGDALAAVRAAEQDGFARIWMAQLPPLAGVAGWDVLTVFAAAGAQTDRIQLASGVLVAHTQHPLALARQALSVSAATGGRLLLGVGVSHRWVVSDVYGYSYQRPVDYLREYLDILARALRGEPVDHHGERLTAVGQLALAGVAAPEVVIAALGPRMLELAGTLTGGTVTSWVGAKTVATHIVPTITAAAEAAGRPAPRIVVGLPVSVTHDVEGARAAMLAAFGASGDMPAYRAMLDNEGVDTVADVCVIGDEDAVLDQLARFAGTGATEFAAIPFGDAETVARTVALLAAHRRVD